MRRIVPGPYGHVLLTATVLALAGAGGTSAGGLYDGTYHGTLKGVGMNAVTCAKGAPVQMTVTDSKLEYHHMATATITATVATDGSFSGSAQNMYAARGRGAPQVQTLDGKIAAGHIQAETKVGNSCTYSLELKKF
jgi:hypothetical protein